MKNLKTVIIGAGAAGIFSACELKKLQPHSEVVILEARDRIGGRVHTVELCDERGEHPVFVDAGATWLQQFDDNYLAEMAVDMDIPVYKSDFNCPLRKLYVFLIDKSEYTSINDFMHFLWVFSGITVDGLSISAAEADAMLTRSYPNSQSHMF
jgi:phytoene dehydrogenase-like protein